MRAAVFYGDHDVRLEDVTDPARGSGEVLLRVVRSGMCGTDATEWSRGPLLFPVQRPHPVSGHLGPMILGHEFIGEVVECGADSRFRVGELVASVSCGGCDRCAQGRTNLCRRYFTYGLNCDGGMAELISVAESTLAPVPDGLLPDHAGLAQPLSVGLHAARRANARTGDEVVLIGAGAIGSFVLAGLRSLAETTVTVVDFAGPRLDRAARLGADHVVAVGSDHEIFDRTGTLGVDVVIEASGAPDQLAFGSGLVRPGGTLLQVGLPAQPQEIDVHSLVMREVTVTTTLAHICGTDLAPSLDILATTNLGEELLDSVRPLSDVPEQLERLAAGGLDGKVLFDPSR